MQAHEVMIRQFITVVVLFLAILVFMGCMARVISERAWHAYWGSVHHFFRLVGRQLSRFARWTLREHWQFWLGLTAGVFGVLYFAGYLVTPP